MSIESFREDLDTYLKKEFSYKRSIVTLGRCLTVNASRRAFSIYIRYHVDEPYARETIVIASIYFRQMRKGHGTRFLGFLVSIANKYNYRHIDIENVGEISRPFALKHGFKIYTRPGYYSQNAIIEVDELRRRLSSES